MDRYTIGDEVRYAATGQFATITDDSNAGNGYYEIEMTDTGVSYSVHNSELN